jgi:hypothetical protein
VVSERALVTRKCWHLAIFSFSFETKPSLFYVKVSPLYFFYFDRSKPLVYISYIFGCNVINICLNGTYDILLGINPHSYYAPPLPGQVALLSLPVKLMSVCKLRNTRRKLNLLKSK